MKGQPVLSRKALFRSPVGALQTNFCAISLQLHPAQLQIQLRRLTLSLSHGTASTTESASNTSRPTKIQRTPLLEFISERIRATGPMTVAEYMREALTNPLHVGFEPLLYTLCQTQNVFCVTFGLSHVRLYSNSPSNMFEH